MGWLVVALRIRLGRVPCPTPGSRARKCRPLLAPRLFALTVVALLPAFASWATDVSEDQKLLASDGAAAAEFGSAVSVDGNVAVVGASEGAVGAGAAYVYRFNGSSWVQAQKLVASDGAGGDLFGAAVAIAGDTIVIGASGANTADGAGVSRDGTGAAYVFRDNGATFFFEEQKLVAPDRAPFDRFGSAVVVAGDTIVVGVPLDDTIDDLGTPGDPSDDRFLQDSGSAWVFRDDGTRWVEEQQLLVLTSDPDSVQPEDPIREAEDFFGISIAVSGDAIVVGADGDDSPGFKSLDPVLPNHGAAYVFRDDGTTWLLEQKLLDPDVFDQEVAERSRAANDRFGHAVAIDGDATLIGSWSDGAGGTLRVGSGGAFRFDGAVWNYEDKLQAADGLAFDQLGISVAISGDYAVLGANQNAIIADSPGAAYVFEYDGVGWPEEHKLTASDAGAFDSLGWAVTIDGGSVLVGAVDDDAQGLDSGAAYAYVVPEPSALALQLSALIALVGLARRARGRAARR